MWQNFLKLSSVLVPSETRKSFHIARIIFKLFVQEALHPEGNRVVIVAEVENI